MPQLEFSIWLFNLILCWLFLTFFFISFLTYNTPNSNLTISTSNSNTLSPNWPWTL